MYIRPKNATLTLQNKVEHTPLWIAKNKLSLHIGKTDLLHFLSGRDESVKMANTTKSPTKSVNYLGVHQDINLTFEAHIQSVLGKMAKFIYQWYCGSDVFVRVQ